MTSFLKMLSTIQRDGGKPIGQQLIEMLMLRLGKSPIGISEYFEYGIWHRSISPSMRSEFIGWRQSEQLDRELNEDYSRVLANDKLLNYLVLRANGYPIPIPLASYSTGGRRIGDEVVLQTPDDVISFLNRDVYPFYVKPISAGYGRGVLGVLEREGEFFRLFNGHLIGLDEFMKPFAFAPYRGMLFQKPLAAHPTISELTGTDAVSCIRFICLITPAGPRIHTAFWKITTGRNMLDNFSHGDYGNCLGAIDVECGKVVRAISRLGPGGQIDRHPTTNRQFAGVTLPDWKRAVDLVHSASKHFPGLALQNWDVALCPDGPVLLELNTESELAVPQAISGRGLMDQRLAAILADIARAKVAYAAAIAQRDRVQ